MTVTDVFSPAITSTTVRFIVVDANHVGQRIDNFLTTQLKGLPRSHLYRLLRKGEVRVNKGRIGPDYRLCEGDQVRIPPLRLAAAGDAVRPGNAVLEVVERQILYEDNNLLVLNKPAGLAVHGGSGLSYGAIEALRAIRPNSAFLELVHRLDRDTSGLLMVAKRRSTLRWLHEQLRRGEIDKRYLALAQGRWQGGSREVNAPLEKSVLSSGERRVRVSANGKIALTRFHPRRLYSNASLLEAELHTGRTHQIRVHGAHVGHPLAGDDKYGDERFNQALQGVGLHRLFLHAYSLRVTLEEGGKVRHFTAPLPVELEGVLERLAEG